MTTRKLISYEASVNWMREQEQYQEMAKFCYFDRDNLEAADRFANSEEFQEVIKILRLRGCIPPFRVLDLGCGNGIASYAFASLGCAVTSVDPDLSDDVGLGATNRLRKFIPSGTIKTVQATAESLPFDDDAFDVIYERQALHHFSDLVKGLTECARVLKSGGLFFATREHVVNDAKQLDDFLARHILHQWHGGENAYPVKYYIKSLKQAGFKSIRTIGPMDNVINHFPASDAAVNQEMQRWLTSKLGSTLGNTFAQLSAIEKVYRRYLSVRNQSPGRLYSFLCAK